MKHFIPATVGAAVLTACAIASVSAQTPTPLKASDSAIISVSATVQAIDLAKREVTLKGSLGNVVTFTVDKRVARLNEVNVGDQVVADYYVSFAAELRAPTAEEKANPMVTELGTAKAPAGTEPAAGALRVTRAVVTVEGLDRPTKSLTVKGPKGNFVTVPVNDVAKLSQLRLGDTIVVTYTEALAVALEKRAPKK